MKSKKEILDILGHAHGSDRYHKYSPIPGYPVATGGVIALAEAAECFWFLDIIGSHQTDEKLDPSFQVWKLEDNHEDNSAVVRGYNDTALVITQNISYTDFPLKEVKIDLMDGVILLPSEY